MTQAKGWHVFAMAFNVIIAVNLTLALNAVRPFPELEVMNSYVASPSFDVNRAAQHSLHWNVSAYLEDTELVLTITQDGKAIHPVIEGAIFGRATMVKADQTPKFTFDGAVDRTPVNALAGNWNLRVRVRRLNMDVPIWIAIILAAGMSLFEVLNGRTHAYFDAALSLMFFFLIGRYRHQ